MFACEVELQHVLLSAELPAQAELQPEAIPDCPFVEVGYVRR